MTAEGDERNACWKNFIVQITPQQVTPALKVFFNRYEPATLPSLFGIGENTFGPIYSDHPQNPTWAIIHEAGCVRIYLDGTLQITRCITGAPAHHSQSIFSPACSLTTYVFV